MSETVQEVYVVGFRHESAAVLVSLVDPFAEGGAAIWDLKLRAAAEGVPAIEQAYTDGRPILLTLPSWLGPIGDLEDFPRPWLDPDWLEP